MTESSIALPADSEAVLIQQLDVVSSVVETAAATLATGHFVDMVGLDRAVADLCAAATALPRPYQHHTAQKLSRLATDLSALAGARDEASAPAEATHYPGGGGDHAYDDRERDHQAKIRIKAHGSGAVEIRSAYGLGGICLGSALPCLGLACTLGRGALRGERFGERREIGREPR